MEFLKALKEAERAGVSRQEFKKVWELQERLNMMRASTQRVWQGLGGNQDSQTGVQDLKAEMHQLKQEITKLRKNLVTRCVALDPGLGSNICQHNQDLEDMKNVLSQLKNEILGLKTLFNGHLKALERQILSSKNSPERHHTADTLDKRLGGYFIDTATQTCDEEQSEEGKILEKAEQHSPELEPRQQQQLKKQHQQNDNQQMMEQQDCHDQNSQELQQRHAQRGGQISLPVRQHNQHQGAQKSEECHDQNSQELHEQQQGQESPPVRQQNQQQGAQTSKGDDRQLSHQDKEQQQNQETSASTSTWSAKEITPGRSAHDIPFLPTDGIVFQFKNIGSSASEGTKLSTPFYRLTDCPVSVGLSIWFDHQGFLNTQLLITVLNSKPGEASRIFELYGDIKNKTAVKFSPLFYGETQIKINTTSCAVIDGDVSLETKRGEFSNITLQELNRRGYVMDDSIFIDWVVIAQMSEECHDQNSQELHEQQQGQESLPVRQQNQQQGAQTSKGDNRQLSHRGKEQQQNQETSASTSTWPANEIKPGRSAHDIPFLPTDGIVFQFKNIGSSASEGTKLSTPFYRLTDCPVSVGLSIWFDHQGFLNTQLLITVLNSKPGEASRIFELYGDIKNKYSGLLSPLFYGESQIQMDEISCAVIDGDVSLKTSRRVFPDVTLEELNGRGYVNDDSIFIDWVVIARKVTAAATSKQASRI